MNLKVYVWNKLGTTEWLYDIAPKTGGPVFNARRQCVEDGIGPFPTREAATAAGLAMLEEVKLSRLNAGDL